MLQKDPQRFDLPLFSAQRGHWRERLRSDFRLAIISLFGVCTVAGILPLAVYRYLDGDWQTGTGDVVLVSIIAGLVVYAWRTGRTRMAARLLAVVITIGFLILVIFSSISFMWAFPILGAGFLLADRVFASISALATLILTVSFAGRFETVVETWSFVTTGVLVAAFGLIFATQTQMQRRQLAEMASRDPLTGAGNRRALRQALDSVERVNTRRGTSASLILIDLDHFKATNDVYGHEAGDRVLVNLVEVIDGRQREGDGLFRLGGEEFVIVLPGVDLQDARRVAGKLKRTIATQLEGPGGPVTVSMGVAQLGKSETVRQWLARADEALYSAKRQGRNRIEVTVEPGQSFSEAS